MKTYNVRPQDRVSSLSHEPNDNTVTVHFENYEKVYDNIHYPDRFIGAIINADNSHSWISGVRRRGAV